MKINFLRLSLAGILVIANYNDLSAQQSNPFPLKKEIYKKGWIDLNKNNKKDIYEDSSQPVEKRINDLLSQMTVEEKTCQLATYYGHGKNLKDKNRRIGECRRREYA